MTPSLRKQRQLETPAPWCEDTTVCPSSNYGMGSPVHINSSVSLLVLLVSPISFTVHRLPNLFTVIFPLFASHLANVEEFFFAELFIAVEIK